MSDSGDLAQDAQRLEWEEFETHEIAEFRCPHSGIALLRRGYFDGPTKATGQVFSCDVCDCFGYNPDEVSPVSASSSASSVSSGDTTP